MIDFRKEIRLLVVDEHKPYCKMLEAASEEWHPEFSFSCEFADSAEEALAKIKEFGPSVVMIDAFTEDMDCFEFMKNCNPDVVPLVVTSEFPAEGMRESVLSKGALECLTKTEDPDELEGMLELIAQLAEECEIRH